MKKALLLVFLCLFLKVSFGQAIDLSLPNSHEKFTQQLSSSKELKYQEILATYDAYIAQHPENVNARVAKCRFIGRAYYDEYEDYDPNWEETDACVEDLVTQFPEEPGVLLLKLEQVYGEERGEWLDSALRNYTANPPLWDDYLRGCLLYTSDAADD